MIQNKLFNYDKEILEIRVFVYEPDWKDKLASKMMELSLNGWWYEALNVTKENYTYAGIILDMRFIRFRNGPNTTNIDAALIGEIIGFTDDEK